MGEFLGLPGFSVMGLPLWRHSVTPASLFRIPLHADHCVWASDGPSGFLVVELAAPSSISSVAIHFPLQSTAGSDNSCAPRHLKLWAVQPQSTEKSTSPDYKVEVDEMVATPSDLLLLDFNYSVLPPSPSLQTFLLPPSPHPALGVRRLRLEILSNHGNPSYTCLSA